MIHSWAFPRPECPASYHSRVGAVATWQEFPPKVDDTPENGSPTAPHSAEWRKLLTRRGGGRRVMRNPGPAHPALVEDDRHTFPDLVVQREPDAAFSMSWRGRQRDPSRFRSPLNQAAARGLARYRQ